MARKYQRESIKPPATGWMSTTPLEVKPLTCPTSNIAAQLVTGRYKVDPVRWLSVVTQHKPPHGLNHLEGPEGFVSCFHP